MYPLGTVSPPLQDAIRVESRLPEMSGALCVTRTPRYHQGTGEADVNNMPGAFLGLSMLRWLAHTARQLWARAVVSENNRDREVAPATPRHAQSAYANCSGSDRRRWPVAL